MFNNNNNSNNNNILHRHKMWLFIAILFLIRAPANSEGAMEAINPETSMNVVSQENFEFPLCLKVCGCLAGEERGLEGMYVERTQVMARAGFVERCDMTLPPCHH